MATYDRDTEPPRPPPRSAWSPVHWGAVVLLAVLVGGVPLPLMYLGIRASLATIAEAQLREIRAAFAQQRQALQLHEEAIRHLLDMHDAVTRQLVGDTQSPDTKPHGSPPEIGHFQGRQ